MSLVSNGGKFRLYTGLNGLIFPTPTETRISFEHTIQVQTIFVILYDEAFCFTFDENLRMLKNQLIWRFSQFEICYSIIP
jgi:cobyrinic acid a,c-diamide synthase